MREPAAAWPKLDYWELEDFFRRLRAAVLELEDAHAAGRLAERVREDEPDLHERIGPDVLESYTDLAAERGDRLKHLRLDAVHALLDQARREIFEIRHWAAARVVAGRASSPAEQPGGASAPAAQKDTRELRLVAARLGDLPEEFVRLDQIVAVRFWGVGFAFDDAGDTDRVAREIARQTALRLARDLRHLQKILLRFRPHDPEQAMRMVPRPEERGFEQLMLDVLNEERACARAAPLSEDFLEKTDLRVRYPGLDRKRGGRVQVTQITDDQLHREKLDRIRRLEEFVVLSPLSLAAFVNGELHRPAAERRGLEHFDLDAFWHCLPDQPTDVPSLATSIKRLLIGALRAPLSSPRGPLAAVPWALRNVIRLFVRHDVFRATRALRAGERRGGEG